ncbi:MAG TPA: hypothetical protein VFG84_12505 [Gemmatimonadaceae bacterium]|nr:hypothetical protein [Gemmatimonadaceae bacterium]
MVSLMSLWLPILLSAVVVFVASSMVHTVLGYHRNDFARLPREDEVMRALAGIDIPPGDYMMPWAGTGAGMKDPAYIEKRARGPVAIMTVMPSGPIGMGGSLAMWFGFTVVVSIFAAYVASRALAPDAMYLDVFRMAGTTAFAGYALALAQGSIWFHRGWRSTLISMFDGLVYALLTGGVMGWLWPR